MIWRQTLTNDARPTPARHCTIIGLLASLAVSSAACAAHGTDVVVVPVAGPVQASADTSTPGADFSPSSVGTDVPDDTTVTPTTSAPPPTTTTTTTEPTTTITAAATTATATTITTSTTTTTTPTTTIAPTTTTTTAPQATLPLPPPPARTIANPFYGASNAAFDRLAGSNAAASMTVVRGGEVVFTRASGRTIDGQTATGDSAMIVASVSKIIVAVAVARLAENGLIDIAAPIPWADIGLAPNPAWSDVTVRELLDHRSGLSKARYSWFTGEGTCRDHVPSLLTSPPRGHRGRWVYSNGNYCLLGLLVEQRTGMPLDQALQQLVFDPVGAAGVHLTAGGLQPGDVAHAGGVERLSRLGGAGTLIVSTDDSALALGRLTPADSAILAPPGVFTDQYGWGHTGTVDGARACVWVLEGGETVVSATIAGNSIGSGGSLCDLVVPAIATDLGIGAGRPDRTP